MENIFLQFQDDEPSPVPDIKELYGVDVWTVGEATSVLSGWSEGYLYRTRVLESFRGLPSERKTFFLPKECEPFEPQSKEALKLYREMKTSIEARELRAIFYPNKLHTSFLVKPEDVIFWALTKNYRLPVCIQSALNLPQMDDLGSKRNIKMKVKIKLIAQFELSNNPFLDVAAICGGELMQKFGSLHENSSIEELDHYGKHSRTSRDHTLKNHNNIVSELYSEKGKPGRRSKNRSEKCARKYESKPIPEVIQFDSKGGSSYQYALFRIIIVTAVEIITFQLDDNEFKKMSYEEFLMKFQGHPVVEMYTKELSSVLRCYVERIVMEEFFRIRSRPLTRKVLMLKEFCGF